MELIDFDEKDYANLYDFMKPLWLDTYKEILPVAQIELLLDKYFSMENIKKFRAEGYEYKWLDREGVVIFVERETEVFMDKLYLLPSARGKGYPTFAFEQMALRGKDITLSVNRKNERAFRAYSKNGFVIEEVIDIPLGNGMVNCDYKMRRKK